MSASGAGGPPAGPAHPPGVPTLDQIRAAEARIRPFVPETPLLRAWDLEHALGSEVWLKCENLQRTGSFKSRGATNWVRSAGGEELRNGLITVSAGNHALALAWAAAARKVPVTVVMPEGSSPMKIEATRRLGAEVVVHGRIQEAVAHTHELAEQRGLTLVHPYDDPRVMAGQGTVGLEVLRQLPPTARILCPVGGGGLVSGVAVAVKSQRPEVAVIGVEPEGAATLRNAWDHDDEAAVLPAIETIAVSLAPVKVGRWTYAASRRYVDDVVTVTDAAIREATRLILTRARLYAETGASVGVAALLQGVVTAEHPGPTVCVLTGGNMDLAQVATL